MDCSKARNLINAYADGELNSRQRQELLSHISSCGKCSVKYNEVIKIKHLLENTPELKAPSDFLSKLHSRMEKENIIDKKDSVFESVFKTLNRPVILRPAAAIIISVIIIAIYRPHEFLLENFKKSDSSEIVLKQDELQPPKQYAKINKPVAQLKKIKPGKQKPAEDSFKFADSNKAFNELEKDDSSPSPAIAEKKEEEKKSDSRMISASKKSRSGMSRNPYNEAQVEESLKRKSRAESYDKPSGDSVAKPSLQSIDSIIVKYTGKILFRDNNKISVSLPSEKSADFFNEISSKIKIYIITGKNNNIIFVDLFLK
jgi:hypothetical protein